MARRIALFDPARRLGRDVGPLASGMGIEVVEVTRAGEIATVDADAILIAPAVANEVGPAPAGGPVRWIVGDATHAGRLAGAAASCGAAGVIILPVSVAALGCTVAPEVASTELDLARARLLVSSSVMEGNQASLSALAEAFGVTDCIVWWKEGETMTPESARGADDAGYRQAVAAAARIAAASGGTVILGGSPGRSVIAEALRTAPTEVAGLFAIVADPARRFSAAERTDLRAVATRLVRELQWMTGHKRLVAEGERLLAGSLLDPLTSALTRGAFEQAVTTEVASATRRGEPLAIGFLDIVGLRMINTAHGHHMGDETLAQVAATLRATIRGNDRLARFGGDELAVLLLGANADQGKGVIEKLVAKVAASPIVSGETSITVGVKGSVTALGPGERSGEAAFARGLTGLRRAKPGEVVLMAPGEKIEESTAEQPGLGAGTIVGGTYRVVHELSRGAMGVVYRGEDLGLSRAVAIKVLRSDLASDRELVAQFRAEAALLAALHHENLVQVYALGEHAGDVYFVMELVEGQPVSEVIRAHRDRGERFPAAAIAQITIEIADALDKMHSIGVIHRDVKPANVLLDRERDRAVLVDVGVATRTGQNHEAAGTPGFAAPESFLAASDAREVDVYGLAATVYAMLTGVPPFGSGGLTQVVARQLNERLVGPSKHRPELSSAVDAVIAKALDPQPKKRWASASTFAVAVARALQRADGAAPAVRVRPETDAVIAAERVMVPTAGITDTQDRPSSPRLAVPAPVPARRPATGKVRAAHFLVAAKVIAQQLGDGAVRKLAAAHPVIATSIAPTHSPLDWLELDNLVTLLWHADGLAAGAELPRQIGRATITATFARLFGANPSSLAVSTVLRAAPAFWRRYHDWCTLTATVDESGATLVLDGEPGAMVTCQMIAGELARVIELAGGGDPRVDHKACRCTGDPQCEYVLAWS